MCYQYTLNIEKFTINFYKIVNPFKGNLRSTIIVHMYTPVVCRYSDLCHCRNSVLHDVDGEADVYAEADTDMDSEVENCHTLYFQFVEADVQIHQFS